MDDVASEDTNVTDRREDSTPCEKNTMELQAFRDGDSLMMGHGDRR